MDSIFKHITTFKLFVLNRTVLQFKEKQKHTPQLQVSSAVGRSGATFIPMNDPFSSSQEMFGLAGFTCILCQIFLKQNTTES
jgi:hypothetical protein